MHATMDAPATAGTTTLTYAEAVAAGYNLWGYDEFATAIGRQAQSLRRALMRRTKHKREDAARRGVPVEQGEAQPEDIPEPLCYKPSRRYPEPKWDRDEAQRWAKQTGKLKADGVTPIPPRSGRKAIPRPR